MLFNVWNSWDAGLHCITLDHFRYGKQEDYFPEREEL